MNERTLNNRVLLQGTVLQAPALSHENHGQPFYRFPLSIRRLSGQEDRVWILAAGPLLALCPVRPGQRLALEGQLRSFNNKTGQGSRLVISVLARTLSICPSEEDKNTVYLSGVLCKPPVLRRTPLGRCICDVMLAVNRRYGRADYLPCIAWGQLAARVGQLSVGDWLHLEGRFQSREYTKTLGDVSQVRTAFEVSVMELREPPCLPAEDK